MKQTFIRILTVVFTVCAACLKAQTPYNDPNWIHSPVWREEFDGDDINNTYWEVRNYFDHFYYRNIDTIDCSASITDEGQLYRNRKQAIGHNHENRDEQPIFDYDISNGMLRLYLHNENCDCPEYARTKEMCSMQYFNEHCSNTIPQYHYTGACIALKNDHKFKYGYLEARIKTNCGNGFFPAFWLYGVNYGSTHQGADYQEIDIFEMTYGPQSSNITHDQNIMTSNRHYLESPTNPPTLFMINDYTNYHKYGLEWTPSKFIYYVDGCIYRIEKNDGIFDPKTIILNFAVHENEVNAGTVFPGIMEVDYVRLFKPRTDYTTILNMNNYDFSNHDNKVKKKIIMNGNNELQATDNVYLRATEGVEINGVFSVPLGAKLYIDVNGEY